MRSVPGRLIHPQHRLHEQRSRTRQDHREHPHRDPASRRWVPPHPQAAVIDLSFTTGFNGTARHRDLAFETLLSERGCDITTYRRFRHLDTVVVAQPLRDRGHRHRHLQLIGDPLVMNCEQRPTQRPRRRVDQLGKPTPDAGPPHLLVELLGARCQTLGQRRGQILADRLTVDAQCLIDLHLGSAGVPVPKHLHEVSHVPRSPRHSRPLPGPPGGAPERSEPEQHPNPCRTRPQGVGNYVTEGGELHDGQPLKPGELRDRRHHSRRLFQSCDTAQPKHRRNSTPRCAGA